MFLGAAMRAEISFAGNLKNKVLLGRRGPRRMRWMLRGDAGGGEEPARYGKQRIQCQTGLGEGGRRGGRMKHAPGSVLSDWRYLNYKF